jgi:hypothetical protein
VVDEGLDGMNGGGKGKIFFDGQRKNRITFGGAVCLEKYKTIDFYTFLK